MASLREELRGQLLLGTAKEEGKQPNREYIKIKV